MQKGKKILIIGEVFYPEEFKINEVAINWKEKGYEVSVLTMQPTYPEGVIYEGYENSFYSKNNYKGIDIYRLKGIEGYRDSLFKKMLKYFSYMIMASFWGVFNGKKFDYIFGYNTGALTAMLPGVIISKIYKQPFVLWVQDIWPDSIYAYGFKKGIFQEFFLNRFVKFIYNNATKISVSCIGFENKIKYFLKNEKKIEYNPNWAEELDFETKKFVFSEKKKKHYLFAGNIGRVQNLENVINGFKLLSDSDKENAQLNFIGDGSYLKELKEIAGSDLDKSIFFWGRKERKDMSKYYNASDYLIISLKDDPIFSITVPSKFQTYLAAEKPILSFVNGEVNELVEKYNLGLFSESNNVNKIKEIFKESLYLKKEEEINYAKSAKNLLEKEFNKNIILDRLTNLMIN